jgi:hypothetical protein
MSKKSRCGSHVMTRESKDGVAKNTNTYRKACHMLADTGADAGKKKGLLKILNTKGLSAFADKVYSEFDKGLAKNILQQVNAA